MKNPISTGKVRIRKDKQKMKEQINQIMNLRNLFSGFLRRNKIKGRK